jgi:SAM-dependent methyltransferase
MTLEKFIHDLCNSLVAVYGFTELLTTEDHKKQHLLDSANRVHDLLENFVKSPGYDKFKEVDMNIPDPPSDIEMNNNRELVISYEQALFNDVKTNTGRLCLNLGCGCRLLEGFVNVDKYEKREGVENYDIFKLPQSDASVDVIFCAHVLEHLPIRHSKIAIKEWGRVMKPGGKVYLGIPDIDLIIVKLLNQGLQEKDRDWLMYTLFGFQTNPGNRDPEILDYPVDPGQFHTSGFNRKSIQAEFWKNNFEIEQILNYDGYGTPSVWVIAVKL